MKKMIPLIVLLSLVVLGFFVFFIKNLQLSRQQALEAAPEKIGGTVMENVVTLVANAGTREEAEEIARLYDITLVEYNLKVATYLTDKEPMALIKWGEEQGYPAIAVNHPVYLHQ